MRHLRPDGKRERGQIIVLFELILIVILAFAALVIDLGVLRNNRQILVNTMDAAALAGGSKMPVNGPTEATAANALINATIAADYPGLTGYTITYKCLIGVNPATNKAWISRDIPGVCDPHNALHHPTPPPYAVDTEFSGAGPTRVSACDPFAGDKCNTVVVTGTALTHYALAPVVGVDQGSTGAISAAACKGACGASPVVPVDLVIILDRTGSMADGSDHSGPKIEALQAAARTVLSVYDPAKQRVALALTGPGAVDASGNSASGSCPAGGTALGVGDDTNFSPSTTLKVAGNTNLAATPTGSFLKTTLTAAISSTSSTSVRVTSATGFPTTNQYTIQIDNEQMRVTAGAGTLIWTVTRGYNGTTKATHTNGAIVGWGINSTNSPPDTSTTDDTEIRVASAASFPATNGYTILVDSERMLVTAGAGTTTWTVTRGYDSTTKALHGGNETVSFIYSTMDTSIRVNSASGFPTSGNYTILVDSEHMVVTGGQGTTTWTVTRGADSTTAATHTGGAAVTRVVGIGDTTIQVDAPHGPAFPGTPFIVAVQPTSGSNYEHMRVTNVTGSSAPYTWTVVRAQDSTPAVTHNVNAVIDGVTPWVPSAATIGVWMPVGLSGTDTETDRALPNPTGANGTYSIGGVVQDTPLVRSINCIQAFSNGTNLTTPIQMAQWYLDHYGRQGVTQGIILETDGHPQVGFQSGNQTTTNSAYTCKAALDAAAVAKADTTNSPDGIQFFTIGYGVDSSSRCPTRTTTSSDSNGDHNMYEDPAWSNALASTLLSQMATDADHYFDNPSTAELSDVFTQAATILAHGQAHLIQLNPKPIVYGVSTGYPSVTISGMYFTGATQVMFGSVGAVSATVNGDTSITATAPFRPSGTTVHVTVTTPGGTSAVGTPDLYTYP